MIRAIILIAFAALGSVLGDGPPSFFVCEAGDERILGEYVQGSETRDGANVYSNANDLSIFRNNDFWYIGNLSPWPPETYYRCVEPEGCNAEQSVPPVPGKWSASRKFGKEPVPVISATPCTTSEEL